MLWLCAVASPALAAPVHPPLTGLTLDGSNKTIEPEEFNKACGTVVDSEGDIYVASAGLSASPGSPTIDVFDPEHSYLTTIANTNEPCGLAVDSKGQLYVSESKTGNVVKYEPNAYPFSGTPTYSGPTPIDSSGEAKGIAVDPFDDRLYVAKGTRIDTYNPDGSFGIDEVQQFRVEATGGTFRLAMPGDGNPTRNEIQRVSRHNQANGGTFTLTFEGQTTGPIKFDAPANEPGGEVDSVQEALEALSTIGAGNVSVVGSSKEWWVEFTGALAKTDVPLISGNGEGLTGEGNWSNEIAVRALSDITAPIPFNATHAEVQAALEGLSTIGTGNVSVASGPEPSYHYVTFVGKLADTDVEALTGDPSGLTASFTPAVGVSTNTQGFNGHIGEGVLTKATGVAAYTYLGTGNTRYVFAADDSSDVIRVFGGASVDTLSLRHTIDGSDADVLKDDKTPDNGIGFGAAGAYLSVDRGNGHVLVYDAEHEVVDEFEATGAYFTQIPSPEPPSAFEDGLPTAIAVFPQIDEVQKLNLSASGGTFKLKFQGEPTAALSFNATASEVKTALEALPAIGAGNVKVFKRTFGSYTIAFVNALGSSDVEQLVVDSSGLAGSEAKASVTTETQGSGPGRVYVTSGASSGAKLLAFGGTTAPSRPEREALSFELKAVCGVAVDSHGNRYLAAGTAVYVYPPASNTALTKIEAGHEVCDIAVDSTGRVYALLDSNDGEGGKKEKVVYYTPGSFPPVTGTKYSEPTTVVTRSSFLTAFEFIRAIGLNPANDHVFATTLGKTIELDSAKNGSAVLNPCFACTLPLNTERRDIAVYGRNGNVYVLAAFGTGGVSVVDPSGAKLLARIIGVGSPKGPFGGGVGNSIDVNESNGHVVFFSEVRGVAEEYEPSGAFLAEFGSFVKSGAVAIDNSGGSNDGNVYIGSFNHLTAFGPLAYGEPPIAKTGTASEVGGDKAILNGTVDPRGFDLTDCHFEYLTDAKYIENGETFAGATSKACAESLAEIGKGTGPAPVHANLSGIEPETKRYRFRLVAANKYGEGEGEAGSFGPPVLTTRPARPVAYTEASLGATIDPSGLLTTYRFQYVDDVTFQADQPNGFANSVATPDANISASAGLTEANVPIFGLSEGTAYDFRIVAENEAKSVPGPVQTFETLERPEAQQCPNQALRTGRSASLPDCRAYELVTPADTRGLVLHVPDSGTAQLPAFSQWLIDPSGEEAGNRLTFGTDGTLPGFEGQGERDGYLTTRTAQGWKTELSSPTYVQAGGTPPSPQGVSPDQLYWFWRITDLEKFPGTLDNGAYLRTPTDYELVGQGSLETDPQAVGVFLSPGATHVVFSSDARLEPQAAPQGTQAIYDRTPEGIEVISVKPDGSSFGAGEDASYIGATGDGSSILFEVGGTLYVRRGEETIEVAEDPNVFAGISVDGSRVFYVDAAVFGSFAPAGLLACDLDVGPCAGPEAHAPIEIAPNSHFVNVSADGTHVYLTSKDVLDEAEEGTLGGNNLYLWDDATETIRFVALLDPQDVAQVGFEGFNVSLIQWLSAVAPGGGRALSPTRSTPDGSVLVFQSHARLTSYDNTELTAGACGDPEKDAERCSEVYRYNTVAAPGKQLTCISCDPSGTAPSSDATLQSLRFGGPTKKSTMIPNIAEGGDVVFFESKDSLLPEDANSVQDVYEWKANGAAGCGREGGCLALISSGQGEHDSFLYSMTPDEHDVFFRTQEKLVGADILGSSSIYDARIDGGFVDPLPPAPCQGDACQGQGSTPPVLPAPSSNGPGVGNEGPKPLPCAKGKHRVKGRCIAKHHKHKRRHRHRRANHDRKAHR